MDRFGTLYEVSKEIGSSLDLSEVLNHVMDAVIYLTKADRGFIMLFNKTGGLDVRTARNINREDIESEAMEVSRGVVQEVVKIGQGVITLNAQADHRFATRESVKNFSLRSIMTAPLQVRGNITGILYVDNKVHVGIFDENQLSLLQLFANQAAMAIENARLYEEMHDSREQLKLLNQQLIRMQEDERRHVSSQLHEDTGQTLAAMLFNLDWIQNALPPELQSLRTQTDELLSMVETLTKQIRVMARDLRPPALATLGISNVLEDYVNEFSEQSELEIEYQTTVTMPLPDEMSICLYRFLQVALTNISKHIHASRVQVNLNCAGDKVRFDVYGNEPTRGTTQLTPLVNEFAQIQQYIELLDGQLTIDASAEHGLRLMVQIPWSVSSRNSQLAQ